MNKIYCTVWNRARSAFVVVSEASRKHSKSSVTRSLTLAALLGSGAATALAGSYDVTAATDNGTGNTANSLSWAINQANTNSGSTINFTSGLTVTPSASLPNLTQPASLTVASGTAQVNATLTYGGSGILTLEAGIGVVGGSGSSGYDDTSSTIAGRGGRGNDGSVGVVSNNANAQIVTGGSITGGVGGEGGWVTGSFSGGIGINGTGGTGGSGGAGVDGSGFMLTNGGHISGGSGGSGGRVYVTGGGFNAGGTGGTGGAGVNGSGFTLTNSGSVTGGSGGSGGFADAGVGGDGGTGGAGVNGSGFTLTNSGSITGGSGGGGGSAGSGAGSAGGSGGVGVSGNGFTLNNDGSITGGSGGSGGVTLNGTAGNGGVGGVAVSGSGFTLNNDGSITGGSGGAGGAGIFGGSGGSGNVGVLATGGATITNSGTISGSNGTAISLGGGNNKLVITSTSVINGNVVSTSGTTNGGDTLALGGLNNASFDLNQTSTDASKKYQGFNNFMKEGSSIWTISGSGSFAGSTTVLAGTLQLAGGTDLSTGNVDVRAGATLGVAGTLNVSGNSNNAGTLNNSGTLNNTGTLNSTGVLSNAGVITNAGSISLSGAATYSGLGLMVLNGNDASGGIFSNTSSNAVAIKSLDVAAGKFGTIAGSGTLQLENTIVNAGATLNNYGTLTNSGALSNNGSLINVGTLTNNVGHVMYNSGGVSNSGTLNNHGTLANLSGAVLDNNGGSTLSSDGALINEGRLNNTTGGTLTNAGTLNSLGELVNDGTLSNSATGVINVVGSAGLSGTGTVNNAGRFNVMAGATAATGTYTQSSSGTFTTSVSSSTSYGKLNVSGTATLGGTLAVDVASGNTLAAGNTLNSVIHAGSISGTFASVTDNSALFDFSASYTATDVNLNVYLANLASTAVNATGNTQAAGAAGTLDRVISNDPTGPIANLLIPLPTQQAVSKAVTQTLPLLSGNSTVVAQNALGRFSSIVQTRLDGMNGLSSGDAVFADRGMWIKPFGSWADQHDRGGVSGYSANTGGMALGADTALSPANRVGLSFGYAHTSASSNSTEAPQSATVDVFQLLGYGSSKIDANTELSYQAGVGQNHTSGQRSLSFASGNAKASYHSLTATAGIGLEKTYKLSEQSSFLPSIRADYSWIKDRAYSETGSAAVAPLLLNVASRSADELILSVNGKLNHKLSEASTFSLNVGAGYDTINQQASISSSYAGAPGISFITYGLDQSPWLARAGLGLVHKGGNGMALTARYDAEYRSGYLNHSASVKASWAF